MTNIPPEEYRLDAESSNDSALPDLAEGSLKGVMAILCFLIVGFFVGKAAGWW